MSLSIYLDDCANAKELARLLTIAGHVVVTPAQAGLGGQDDIAHFRHAQVNRLVLLTKNPDDFAELHANDGNHAGILLIYQDNNPDRDRDYGDIVRAIANLENAKVELAGQCLSLNAWRH